MKNTLDLWRARKQKAAVVVRISPRPAGVPVPLSRGQERLWFLQQMQPDNPFYQYAHVYDFRGALHITALTDAFQLVAQRHSVLRTNFRETENGVAQHISPDVIIPVETVDLSHLTLEKQREKLAELTRERARRTFDLSNDALLRVTVFQLNDKAFSVLLSMHHIIGDRQSLLLLHEELAAAYRELTTGENTHISPLDIQYGDYAYWQKTQQTKAKDRDFWLQQLAGDLPVTTLPADAEDGGANDFAGASMTKIFSEKLSAELKETAKNLGVTPFVLFSAAFQILLYRYTGQEDLLVGTPFTNRDKTELEKLIGFFNETLVLRGDLRGNPTFSELIARTKKRTTEAFAHKNMPFEELVKALKIERSGTENPLFRTMFLYNAAQPLPLFAPDLTVTESVYDLGVAKFDLTLFITDRGENLSAAFEYATHLYQPQTIENLHRHFENLLKAIVAQPEAKISDLEMLTIAEKEDLLFERNKTKIDLPAGENVLTLFTKQAKEKPETTCLSVAGKNYTYAAIDTRSRQVAAALQAQNIGRDDIVGLHVGRSAEMLVGILGILRAGAAYLPLDPDYPAERLDFMLADARVELVLTTENLQSQLSKNDLQILTFNKAENFGKVKDNALSEVENSQLAYVIYTSGSTGKPKGVPVSHENLYYSTAARFHFYEQQPQAFLLMSSFAFDSSIAGIFWTLTQGGTLVLPPKRSEQDPAALAQIIAENRVTHTLMLPSLYTLLLDYGAAKNLQSLNTIMVAGEACTPATVRAHFRTLHRANLYNEYGPTEGTVWCTAHKITPEDATGTVPIGLPIPNVQNYILDKNRRPVPAGVAGELYIGGRGLAAGYLYRPDLTAEKFVEVNLTENRHERLYRTGDAARYRADGKIEFLGRIDRQVKIRGYRIEPDEIAAVLQNCAGVQEAVITVIEAENGKQLAAFFTGENAKEKDVRATLKNALPAYIMPTFFTHLAEFPRLPNGKIQHGKLPQPTGRTLTKDADFAAPQTEAERKIAAVWEEVLQVTPIGLHDNFFDIGGDSVLSIKITAKLRAAGFSLAANALFRQQTVGELAAAISEKTPDNDLVVKNLQVTQHPLSFMQQAFLLHRLQNENDQGLLQLEFALQGNIDPEIWRTAWQRTTERHAVLRTVIETKTVEIPLQTVRPEVAHEWVYLDFSGKNTEAIEIYRREFAAQPPDFSAPGISHFALLKIDENRHLFLWACHHILIDGWSGGLILQDLLTEYAAAAKGEKSNLGMLPTYPAFLAQQNEKGAEKAAKFWRDYLQNFTSPTLLTPENPAATNSNFLTDTFQISEEKSTAIRAFAQRNRVSIGTLLQAGWGLLMQRFLGTDDVVFGTTTAGRSADFPMIDKMSGLFMNVLPTRVNPPETTQIGDWLQDFQARQTAANAYDQTTTEAIIGSTDLPAHRPLFDCLFVFGNFLKDGLRVGELAVTDFRGGFTSGFPLTLRVNPTAALGFDLRRDAGIISEKENDYLREMWLRLLDLLAEEKLNFAEVKKIIPAFGKREILSQKSTVKEIFTQAQADYIAPRNATELHLTKIWEGLFGRSPIGVTENFFDIGGKSLLAMQLFSKLEEETGKILPPTVLMQHPTIEKLAKKITGEITEAAWTTIVPLRATGTKTPLFCVHAGGAHVFFYNALTRNLPADQPVFAVQPSGLDGISEFHVSIEEMATHYVRELRKVQPEGPYRLLGTCFSNAVCLEMANQMHAAGLSVTLYIVDSAPAHLVPVEEKKPVRRFLKILADQNWRQLYKKLRRRYLIISKKVVPKPRSEAQIQLQNTIDSLNKVYAAYTWKPFPGKIVLIRSTQFAHYEGKNWHLTQWRALAGGELEVHVIEGEHLTIFAEPAVGGVARVLEVAG